MIHNKTATGHRLTIYTVASMSSNALFAGFSYCSLNPLKPIDAWARARLKINMFISNMLKALELIATSMWWTARRGVYFEHFTPYVGNQINC